MSEYQCVKCKAISTTTAFCGVCNLDMTVLAHREQRRSEMEECTHTSDWWKNMVPCACFRFAGCGAMYTDEEADQIGRRMHNSYASFTAEQQAIINRHQAEEE
jgi:hypothetical protein